MNIGQYAGQYRYMLQTDTYSRLSEEKTIQEVARYSGQSQGTVVAVLFGAAECLKNYGTEGHAISLPALGTLRFAINAKSVASVEEVGTDLIETRKVLFTPSQGVKDALHDCSISITCYDRNGDEVKRVTSSDGGSVDDGSDDDDTPSGGGSGTESGGGSDSGNSSGDDISGGY